MKKTLILAALLVGTSLSLWTLGLIADLMAANRSLLEDIQLRGRRVEFDTKEDETR